MDTAIWIIEINNLFIFYSRQRRRLCNDVSWAAHRPQLSRNILDELWMSRIWHYQSACVARGWRKTARVRCSYRRKWKHFGKMPAGQIMIMLRERRWFLIMIKNFMSSAGNYTTPHLIRRWWKICNLFFHASTAKRRTAFKVEHSYNWVKAVKQSITVQRPWMDSLLSSGQNKTHTQPWLVFSPSSCRNCVLKISIWIRKSEHSSRIFIGELRNLCCCCWLKKELKNPVRKRRNMPLSKAHSAIVRHCVWSKSIRCCCESQPSADFFSCVVEKSLTMELRGNSLTDFVNIW